ncbi:MAG: hypothetical protein AB7O52_19850 [Planctomycetota bacterium]
MSPSAEREFFAGVQFAEEFLLTESRVHKALKKLTRLLHQANIPYAIVGAMALNEYGYRRTTEAVDVLLTREGLEAFKSEHLGLGYVERFPGSRELRDTENGVSIDVLLAGHYPGDGKPKPVAFPDPSNAVVGEEIRLLPLPRLLELKIASGMLAPHRLRDLADVLELIRLQGLDETLAVELDPFVREKYLELCAAARSSDPE